MGNAAATEGGEIKCMVLTADINSMLDKVLEGHTIPFDRPTSICGLLGAQFR